MMYSKASFDNVGWNWFWIVGRLAPGVAADATAASSPTLLVRLDAAVDQPVSDHARRYQEPSS